MPLQKITTSLLTFLDQMQPELITDISERGMMLTGGGALLLGIDTLMQQHTGLPIHIADSPLNSVVLGTEAYLQGQLQTTFVELPMTA